MNIEDVYYKGYVLSRYFIKKLKNRRKQIKRKPKYADMNDIYYVVMSFYFSIYNFHVCQVGCRFIVSLPVNNATK